MPKLLRVDNKYRSYEWLYSEYITNCKPSREIALIVGCDRKTIDQWLKKVGISKRGFGGSRGVRSKRWLINQYIKKEKSMAEIGKEIGEDTKTIHRWMINYKIPRRTIAESELGSKSHFWRGGGHTSKSKGYVYIYMKNHPFVKHNGYVVEHRAVVEKAIGRFLTKDEVVHHINYKRDDNRLENLYLFKTHREHMSYHYKINHGKKMTLKSNILE
jgi:hypothetical protein